MRKGSLPATAHLGAYLAIQSSMSPRKDQPPPDRDGGRPPQRRLTPPEIRAQRGLELEEIAADIGARLRSVCAHLSADAFTELVRDMARTQLRFRAMDRRWNR